MLNRILNSIDDGFISLAAPLLLLARLIICWYFGNAGLEKLGSGYAEAASLMESQGVPTFLLPLVILLELGGALFMALGLLTRLTSVALAAFTLAADFIFNTTIGTTIGRYLVGAEFTIVAAFLALMAAGAGQWSLDALRTRKRPPSSPGA
ncbi:MAG: DoxX family protein [Bauldia sp.]|nr:DoxX family protein [Bauldia sp.]